MSPLLRVLLKRLRPMFRRFDLDITKIGKDFEWLPHKDVDPVTYQYLVLLRHVPCIHISIAHARSGGLGFPYEAETAHPFVLAFRAAQQISIDERRAAVQNVLSAYYDIVRPRSALEVLDLSRDEAPGLLNLPADAWLMPWDERSVQQNISRRRASVAEEGFAHKKTVTSRDGLSSFGPVSDRRLRFEVDRIADLVNSMESNGFRYDPEEPLEVFGLRVGERYRWVVMRGQHRFAACTAFDVATVQARVVKIIRRDDASFWPHVVSGTFSVTGALRIFDRLFAGQTPRCVVPWALKTGVVLAQRA